MRSKRTIGLLGVFVVLLTVGWAIRAHLAQNAEVPPLLNYQGALADRQGNALVNQVPVHFCLYRTATGGTLLWEEQQIISPGTGGTFSVLLGSQTPFASDMFQAEATLYLGLQVGSDGEMVPRQRVVSTPYALVAQQTNEAQNVSSIPSGMIAMFDGACPPGWTRVSSLDGRVPRGAAAYGATGGANEHAHATGEHSHTLSGSTGGASRGDTTAGGQWFTSDRGDPEWQHRHDLNLTTDKSGSGNTAGASSWPPYLEVVFCRKD